MIAKDHNYVRQAYLPTMLSSLDKVIIIIITTIFIIILLTEVMEVSYLRILSKFTLFFNNITIAI